MTKAITLTPDLQAKFQEKFGQEVDVNNFYIIKVRAISTEAVHQNTIFDGAVLDPAAINEMSNIINFTDENVGVLTMHDSDNLNVGRVFWSEVGEQNGVTALYAYMAILRTDESKDLIAKIDNNVLDEVSVSFTPKHAVCSMCDFDYMSDEADMMNWFNRTCPNGHEIGVDGCHLKLSGIANFSEISIVNRGAAHKAKILNQNGFAHYSEEELKKLAASGKKPEMFVATFIEKLEKDMTTKENVELSAEQKIAELEAKNAELQQSLDLAAKVKSLETQLQESLTKVAEMTEGAAKAEEAKAAALAEKDAAIEQLKAEKAEKETQLSEAMAFLKSEIEKVLTASGEKDLAVPENLDGMSKLLSERQQLLATLVPADGVSASAMKSGEAQSRTCGYTDAQLKAFQVKQ